MNGSTLADWVNNSRMFICLDLFKVDQSSQIPSLSAVALMLLFVELRKKVNDSEFNIIYSKIQATMSAT